MSTPIAVVGMTFGGTDVQDPDGICLHTIREGAPGAIPDVRGGDQIAPGKPGRFGRNRRTDHMDIVIAGWVRGDPALDEDGQREDYYNNRIALAALFDPTVRDTLAVTLPGGAIYTIEALTIPDIAYDQIVPAYADVTIQLESIDPDWVAAGS